MDVLEDISFECSYGLSCAKFHDCSIHMSGKSEEVDFSWKIIEARVFSKPHLQEYDIRKVGILILKPGPLHESFKEVNYQKYRCNFVT